MDHIKLAAQTRAVTGKKVSNLRREGIIPIVVYGSALDGALSLQVNERELTRALGLAGTARVIDLEVEQGERYPVLARSVQRHPTRNDILHADFLAVNLNLPIQADVRVVLVGESPIEETGEAVLTQVATTVIVEALPDRLPSQIEVDISGLSEIGQTLNAGELQLAGDVTLISDPETLIVSVTPPMRAPAVAEEEEEVEDVEALEEGEEADEDEEGEEAADEE